MDQSRHARDVEASAAVARALDSLDRVRKVLERHAGLVVAFGLSLTVAMRVMGTAGYDPTVAAGLLANSDTAVILVSILLSSVGPFVAFVAGYLWIDVIRAKNGLLRASNLTTASGASMIAIFIGTSLDLLIVVVLPLMYLLYLLAKAIGRSLEKRRRPSPNPSREPDPKLSAEIREMEQDLPHQVWSMVVVGLLPWLLLMSLVGPWLPPEVITFEDGSTTVAYVIKTDGDWTTLLLERDRLLRTEPSDRIVAREVCATGPRLASFARFVLYDSDPTATCPEVSR